MKKVLITGGATGIGKATAELFCKNGWQVYITYNNTEPDASEKITALHCDVCDEKQIEELFQKVGDIDVLVNNAGISLVKQIQDTTAEEYDNVMNTNCKSAFLCCREAVKIMLSRHSGRIINVSSMWGEVGASCEVAYSVSKAGVIGLTKALARELAPEGITVNCVSPGIIDTRMNAQFSPEELAEEVPMGRLGTPEEVAQAIFFFSQADYVTGQVLGVNGAII